MEEGRCAGCRNVGVVRLCLVDHRVCQVAVQKAAWTEEDRSVCYRTVDAARLCLAAHRVWLMGEVRRACRRSAGFVDLWMVVDLSVAFYSRIQ
jgi:hypothetical protein